MFIFRRLVNTFSRSKLHEEIDAEIQSHVEMRMADNIAAGMSPEEARRDALIRFGSRVVMRERITAADAATALDAVWRDLRYAARQLRRSPTFTVSALVTLILGIGANVVVFSVLNALVLRPLDVPQPAGLYNVVHQPHGTTITPIPITWIFRARIRPSAIWRRTGSRARGLAHQTPPTNAGTTESPGITLTCSAFSLSMAGFFIRAMNMGRIPRPTSS